MKVYVLNMGYTYGMLSGTACVGVYDTEEEAQKAMEERVDMSVKEWEKHWQADSTKHLNIIKGKKNSVILALGAYKYFTITIAEKEAK